MKHFKEIVRRTSSSVNRLVDGLKAKMEKLEQTIDSQKKRIDDLEVDAKDNSGIHLLEQQHEDHIHQETQRRNGLNDKDLKVDLELQYGTTKWAKKLISDILKSRFEVTDTTCAIEGGSLITQGKYI